MSDCIQWLGVINRDGYGQIRHDGRKWAAHRLTYTEAHGPIPEGMTVDHLCFNRGCVNVEHLRLLTPSENARNQRSAQKTHCKNGHAFTPENTYDTTRCKPTGRRSCRACNAAAARRYKDRKAGAA